MTFEPECLAHDQLASVQAAVSMESELESSSISVSMVGRSVLLEGYVRALRRPGESDGYRSVDRWPGKRARQNAGPRRDGIYLANSGVGALR